MRIETPAYGQVASKVCDDNVLPGRLEVVVEPDQEDLLGREARVEVE